jgi:phosphatidylglycerophosphate synthase
MDFALDDKIAKLIVDNIPIFRYIHPNIISLLSIILNIIILIVLVNNNINVFSLLAILATRWLTDLLDGAVARKYKKVTKLGGILDTIGDVMIIFIFMWYIFKLTGVNMMLYYVFIVIVLIYIYHMEVYHDHSELKHYNGNNVQKIIAFFVNNSYLVYAGMYVYILYNSSQSKF